MSEDNKTLEEQLHNQAQTANETDPDSAANKFTSTTQTTAATADNSSVEPELTGSSQDLQEILAALSEQLNSTQQGQLQQILAHLTQDKEALLQANENLLIQLEDQNQQLEAAKRRYIGLAAEFDNFRKRTQREKEEFEKQAKRKTLNELLTVVDDFERARRLIQPANDGEMAIHKSYQGVYKKFVDSLKSLGVSAMRTEGQPFDPMYHEALLSEPTNEYPEGTIIEELDRGYLLDDQVLRYAKVKVAAPGDPETLETGKNTEAMSDA